MNEKISLLDCLQRRFVDEALTKNGFLVLNLCKLEQAFTGRRYLQLVSIFDHTLDGLKAYARAPKRTVYFAQANGILYAGLYDPEARRILTKRSVYHPAHPIETDCGCLNARALDFAYRNIVHF